MNKQFIPRSLAAGLIGLVLAIALAGPGLAAKLPKIQFKVDTWDFGKVKQGAVLDHEFVFKNVGDVKLNIGNVETSCGCTAALVSDKALEPGQEGRIKVSFNSAGYTGDVSKYVYVDSDDPDKPRLQLKITAQVQVPPSPRAEISPYSVDAGVILEGEAAEASVTLSNQGELELQVDMPQKNAAFSMGGKPVNFPLKIAAGKDVTLDVKFSLPNRMGVIAGESIVFRTNDPLHPTLFFSLRGYVVSKAKLKEFFNRYKDLLK
jgi:hypothetical protein